MRIRNLIARGILIALIVLISGCAHTSAPRNWLPTATEAEKDAYGAWISIEYGAKDSKQAVKGELIAINPDEIYVLVDDSLVNISLLQIGKCRLTVYDSQHGLLGLWTLGGSLSTGTHGIALLFSLPAWIISGSIAAAAQSRAPMESYPDQSWSFLRKYARFPQGLPPGLDRGSLFGKRK